MPATSRALALRIRARLWAWARGLLPRRKLVGLALLLLVPASAVAALRTYRYFTQDRSFCVSCHHDSRMHLRESSHASLPCASCHSVKFKSSAAQYFATKFEGSQATVPHAAADRSRCEACHLRNPQGVLPIAQTVGHKLHVLGKPRLMCTECHGGTRHIESPNPAACPRCHRDVRVRDPAMAKVPCVACHSFLARATTGGPEVVNDCQRCHGGNGGASSLTRFSDRLPASVVGPDSVHGNVNACRLCHNPHSADPAKQLSGKDCGRCHGRIARERELGGDPAHDTCETCHAVHGPRPDLDNGCARCHADRAPSERKTTLADTHQPKARCTSCHLPHQFNASRDACSGCHEPEAELVAASKASGHNNCAACHKGHAAERPAAACGGCHAAQQGHAHQQCTTCHEPHRDRSATKTCPSCHARENEVLAHSGAAKGHARCQSCHQPHAPRAALGACPSCHQPEANAAQSAPAAQHQRCPSCHQSHAFAASTNTCRGCHKTDSLGSHSQECTECHSVHGPPGGAQVDCTSCHGDIPRSAGKHEACRSCHTPHRSQKGEPACAACHQGQTAGALAWKPAEHNACPSCHQEHQPEREKRCGQCHAAQSREVAASKHKCSSCHDQHREPVQWWATCQKCHGAQAAGARTRGPTHSACASCHEPHTAKSPDCRSCHRKLPGMHAGRGHTQCSRCHDTHAVRRLARADCIACHADRVQHFPKANQCSSCHLFK
ncbi:MAG: cytochrome c3 family protein [Polyangiaceae bacterium]|nr:cytochrome c3 family protein [Polyangiaceae bacterium]